MWFITMLLKYQIFSLLEQSANRYKINHQSCNFQNQIKEIYSQSILGIIIFSCILWYFLHIIYVNQPWVTPLCSPSESYLRFFSLIVFFFNVLSCYLFGLPIWLLYDCLNFYVINVCNFILSVELIIYYFD